MYILSHDRPIVQGYPDGCQHRFTNTAEAKTLPHEGASALVIIGVVLEIKFKATIARNLDWCNLCLLVSGSWTSCTTSIESFHQEFVVTNVALRSCQQDRYKIWTECLLLHCRFAGA